MRWVLSSAAAPEASLPELLDAAGRKKLQGVELVRGHGHGIEPGLPADSLELAAGTIRDHGLTVAAYRIRDHAGLDPEETARLARVLDAAVVLALPAGMAERSLERWAFPFESEGRALLLEVEDPAETETRWSEAVARRFPGTVCFAWDAPRTAGTADQARWMLEAFGSSLAHVRVPGTGPESLGDSDGRIGSLVTVLTLSGYRGSAVLAPSSERRLDEWSTWLGRRRGWGCGGARSGTEESTLTSMGERR